MLVIGAEMLFKFTPPANCVEQPDVECVFYSTSTHTYTTYVSSSFL